jgi:signal transduction histidine kinase
VALRIPEREPLRDLMERALERADEVLIESRDKVKDLRDVSGGEKDLSEDIAETGRLFATDKKIDFSVTVHGSTRDLHLIVREETFLITREALANAFTHAQAGRIEVELFYERAGLRVNVRDDGRGIDEETLLAGRTGHWGLLGMRERAQKIGATLQIYSRANAGTELDLRIPAALAYNDRRLRKRWSWRAA